MGGWNQSQTWGERDIFNYAARVAGGFHELQGKKLGGEGSELESLGGKRWEG